MSGFGTAPFGVAPFAGAIAGGGPVDTIVDGLGIVSTARGLAALLLQDGVGLDAAAIARVIQCLQERIALTGTAFPTLETRVTATDGTAYAEALAVGWQIAVGEDLALLGSAQGQPIRLAAIVDTLHATGLVATRLDALSVIATVLAVNGMTATGWKLDAVDSIAFQDALAGSLRAVGAIVDSAGFADTPSPALRITAVLSDQLGTSSEATPSLEALEQLRDEVLFYVTLRLGDVEYAGWVLNGGTASEYRNYPFNGFVGIEGTPFRYYGTAEDGLYLLEGDDDDGEPIDAWITTALMDFGSGKRKRLPDVYVAFIGGDQLLLKVITTNENGAQTEHHYTSDVPPGTALRNGRIKVGRGLESRYWQFTLQNVDGAAFALDELAFRPLILDRRI